VVDRLPSGSTMAITCDAASNTVVLRLPSGSSDASLEAPETLGPASGLLRSPA
jgi:hypothetical protein